MSGPNLTQFCSFGNFDDNEDIKRAWENMKDNIKISAKEYKS
jgi:hypothetical protein